MKNGWCGWPGIEPTTLDLSSQSGVFDLSAPAKKNPPPPIKIEVYLKFRVNKCGVSHDDNVV